MSENRKKTEQFSSVWANKLMQHTDVLHSIQQDKIFKPITIQVAPVEACDSDCPFCCVAGRPLKSYMPFKQFKKMADDFKYLGGKSMEISGGGNPMLYKDRETGETINDLIKYSHELGYDVGLVTNSHNLKRLDPEIHHMINWIRLSLIQLDEGRSPEDYHFNGFPEERIGFSYVIYDDKPNPLARTKRFYPGTGVDSIHRIRDLIKLHPKIKFARLSGDLLVKGESQRTAEKYIPVMEAIDKEGKMFFKEIGDNEYPFDDACYSGMLRPWIGPNPAGGDYQVYVCCWIQYSKRTYDMDYSLCGIDDIIPAWDRMNKMFQEKNHPYEVKGNNGCGWIDTCTHCYYKQSNSLIHSIVTEMPDKNFA